MESSIEDLEIRRKSGNSENQQTFTLISFVDPVQLVVSVAQCSEENRYIEHNTPLRTVSLKQN